MLGLDGSMTVLVVKSQAVKMTSQEASSGSFLTGLDHLSICRVSNMSFPFVFILCLKEPFCMGSKLEKEFIYILFVLSFLHSFPFASSKNKRLLQYEHSFPQKTSASLKVVYDLCSLMVGASLV